MPELIEIAEVLLAPPTFVFLPFILTLLKLDVRPKELVIEAPSVAEAGFNGMDSTNDQRAAENHDSVLSFCL